MEDKVTNKQLENYVTQVEFLKFKEQVTREMSEKESKMRDEIYEIRISNAKIVPLLEVINKNINDIDKKVSEVNESNKEVGKSVGAHTVDIAVLKELHNSKAPPTNESASKGLSAILEYKKTIMVSVISFASAIVVAILNNADKILAFFGL